MEKLIISNKDTSKFDEVAIVIDVVDGKSDHPISPKEDIIELKELVQADGSEVKGEMIVYHDIDEEYYMTREELEYITRQARELKVDVIVTLDQLTGKQLKAMEGLTRLKVIDRTMLLLDIWSKRTTRREGKIEVEKAQLSYRLERLEGFQGVYKYGTGMGVYSPTGNRLLTDEKEIKNRLESLETDLSVVVKNRFVQRSKKSERELPLVALTGYTNSGKSTLMNKLLSLSPYHKRESDVYVQDQIISTVDVTMKKRTLPNGTEFLIVDTIGFVSNLPESLKQSFKSTIEEVNYADLILNVYDSSDSHLKAKQNIMNYTFEHIGADKNPKINVYNKCDKLDKIPESTEDDIYISAKSGLNLDTLIKEIEKRLNKIEHHVTLLIPYKDFSIFNEIKGEKIIEMEDFYLDAVGIRLNIVLNQEEYEKYKGYIL